MNAVTPTEAVREFEMSAEDFRRIAAVVHKTAGIVLHDTKRPLVYSRLAKRLRSLKLKDFDSYCTLVEGSDGKDEREELILAITTNVTAFFRERHHFEFLEENLLPDLIARARAGGRVRIWSAACSSGEEPYSLALTILGTCPEAAKLDIRILATDIDRNMVNRAQTGVYPATTKQTISKRLMQKYTDPVENDEDHIRISDEVKALITFKQLNLLEKWPMKGPFDVIFCRNVVIYFDRPTQEILWRRFVDLMPPGSHIMIGHSERVSGPAASQMSATGITTYVRQ